jgi:hypothetical protein
MGALDHTNKMLTSQISANFSGSSSVNPVQSIQFPRVAAIPKKEPHREENSSSRDAPLAEMGGMEKASARVL